MPEILGDATGIQSNLEGTRESEENASVQQVRTMRKQTEALIQSLGPIKPAKEDILLAMISEKFREPLPADLLLVPSTTIIKEIVTHSHTDTHSRMKKANGGAQR